MQETWVRFLGWEDPLEKEMATHSSVIARRIPWTEEPGRLQSMGLYIPKSRKLPEPPSQTRSSQTRRLTYGAPPAHPLSRRSGVRMPEAAEEGRPVLPEVSPLLHRPLSGPWE